MKFHLNCGWKQFNVRPSPFFLRLASNAFPDIGSVGRIEKKKKKTEKKIHRKSRNKRPGTQAPLPWSLETTRHEPEINIAGTLVDVLANLRQRGKKDQPPKLYVVTMLIF